MGRRQEGGEMREVGDGKEKRESRDKVHGGS